MICAERTEIYKGRVDHCFLLLIKIFDKLNSLKNRFFFLKSTLLGFLAPPVRHGCMLPSPTGATPPVLCSSSNIWWFVFSLVHTDTFKNKNHVCIVLKKYLRPHEEAKLVAKHQHAKPKPCGTFGQSEAVEAEKMESLTYKNAPPFQSCASAENSPMWAAQTRRTRKRRVWKRFPCPSWVFFFCTWTVTAVITCPIMVHMIWTISVLASAQWPTFYVTP